MSNLKNFLFFTTACSACSPLMAQQVSPTLPNVIIILADDIGYGDLSCNGEKTIYTPNVDALANAGIRFTNAHAVASTSTPSRYSLFTGHYCWRRPDTGVAPGDAGMIIRPEQYTMADLFKSCGYTTAAIGKWHLGLGDKTGTQDWNGFISPGPADIGFDYSYLMAATGDRVPCVFVENQQVVSLNATDPISVSYKTPFPGEPLAKDHPELLTTMRSSPNHGHDQAIVNGIGRIGYMKGGKSALWKDEGIADSITSHAVKFIEEHKDRPFFMYFGTNDIHVPRVPHPRFKGKSGMGARGDALLEFDWSVGEITSALKRLGLSENTIVIISSDNGPVVDDGYQDQSVELLGEHRPWGPFRGGKYSAFEAGTRIPFVLSWPNQVEAGTVSNALVSHIDLTASFASMLNQELPADAAPDSQDQLAAFLGRDKNGREYVIESAGTLSILFNNWKYIVPSDRAPYSKLTNTELGNSRDAQLYDLEKDTGEKNNLARENRQRIEELEQIIESEKAKR